jgi:hypothetical protein
MAGCDIRAGRICNAERGRATRRFWASPVVTVNDADDWVAGCSPQFRAAQLRSQKLGPHPIACEYAGYDACKQHRTSEQPRRGGKPVSYSVQTHAQTLTSSTAVCHPEDCRRVVCFVSIAIKKILLKIGSLPDTNRVTLGDYCAPWLKHEN